MKSLISSLSLKTMPLSVAGVFLGGLLAVADYHVHWGVVLCVVLTAASLHVFQHAGNKMALVPSVVCAVLSVYLSFGKIFVLESLLLLLFAYFIMRFARGFLSGGRDRVADAAVFVFLTGPVAVFGTFYLCSHSFGSWVLLFPALSTGILAAATAGLSDGFSKVTVMSLTIAGLVMMSIYPFLRIYDSAHYRFAVMIPLYIMLLVKMGVDKARTPDSYQSLFAFCLLTLAVVTGLGYVTYLL